MRIEVTAEERAVIERVLRRAQGAIEQPEGVISRRVAIATVAPDELAFAAVAEWEIAPYWTPTIEIVEDGTATAQAGEGPGLSNDNGDGNDGATQFARCGTCQFNMESTCSQRGHVDVADDQIACAEWQPWPPQVGEGEGL